ncbi:MAG: hypothetical protein GY702_23070, partial [Desulfobulbaceae bacterium]|nr:hypothetical protein [Desulfobulbaceae bacterium]
VLIYFNRDLQNRVCKLFCNNLVSGGYLCLGSKESIRFMECEKNFEDVVQKEKIYRKMLTQTQNCPVDGRCTNCLKGE